MVADNQHEDAGARREKSVTQVLALCCLGVVVTVGITTLVVSHGLLARDIRAPAVHWL